MLAGYEERREAFSELGISIVAGTVDSIEDTSKVAEELGFPVAHGMTRADGEQIGAWWEDRRDHIQPSEFVIRQDGRVIASNYSSSPIGRSDPEEALTLMKFITKMAKKS